MAPMCHTLLSDHSQQPTLDTPPSTPDAAASPGPSGDTWRRLRIFEMFPILLAIIFNWVIAIIVTESGHYDHSSAKTQANCRTDQSDVLSHSPWIRFPYPGQWGGPIFTGFGVVACFAGAISAMVESVRPWHGPAWRRYLRRGLVSMILTAAWDLRPAALIGGGSDTLEPAALPGRSPGLPACLAWHLGNPPHSRPPARDDLPVNPGCEVWCTSAMQDRQANQKHHSGDCDELWIPTAHVESKSHRIRDSPCRAVCQLTVFQVAACV